MVTALRQERETVIESPLDAASVTWAGEAAARNLTAMNSFAERDWKYLRSIEAELLETLSRRNNDELRKLLAEDGKSESEKRRAIFRLVREQDKVVAHCFDDWRRSRIAETCLALVHHELLTPEQLAKLSPEARDWIKDAREGWRSS